MGKFLNRLKFLDIFGQRVILNFHEDNQIQTTFGGMIACLVATIVFIFFYSSIDVQLEQCTFKHWNSLNREDDIIITQEQYNTYNISNYLCPKYGTNFTVEGQIASPSYSFLKFTVTGCQNQTDPQKSPNLWKPVCPPIETQQKYYNTSTIRIQFLISNYIINPTQVGQFSTRYVANDVFFQIQPGYMYTTADIYMTENVISEDTSLYPWTNIKNQSLAVQQQGDYRQQYTFGNNTQFGAFFLNRSRFFQQFNISYLKVDNLIAVIGGFVQSVMVVAGFLVGIYNQSYYTIELANEIYDFDIQTNTVTKDGKSIQCSPEIESSKRDNKDFKINNSVNPCTNQPKQNKIFQITKQITQKLNNNQQIKQNPGINIITNDSPGMDFTLSPNNRLNMDLENQPEQSTKRVQIQVNQPLTPLMSDKDYQISTERMHYQLSSHQQLNNQLSNRQNNNSKHFKFLNVNSDLKENENILKNDIILNTFSNQTNSINNTSNKNNQKKINFEEIEDLKNTNIKQEKSPKYVQKRPAKLSLTEADDNKQKRLGHNKKKFQSVNYAKTQTNDILKYSTSNPLSLTQIDKKTPSTQIHFIFDSNPNPNDQQNQNYEQYNTLKNVQTLSSPQYKSNPTLILSQEKPQNEKQSLIFFDSSIEPESDIESFEKKGDSVTINRKSKNTVFHTIQPQPLLDAKFGQRPQKRIKSYSDFGAVQETSGKQSTSFQSLRKFNTLQPGKKKINQLTNTKFEEAYKEEMRKDYMTKQFQKVFSKRQKLCLTFKYFVYKLSCGKFYCTRENMMIDKANTFLQKDIDIIVILNKIKELEKLKCLLLDQNQLALFNYFPKPLLSIDNNKNMVKKEEMLREVKNLEKKMKNLDIQPQHLPILKKARDKFKGLLNKNKKQTDLFDNNNLLHDIEQNQYKNYQKLFKAYEQIILKSEGTRMDNILIQNLGEETMKIFQDSMKMQFGMEKLIALMNKTTDKSQKIDKSNLKSK